MQKLRYILALIIPIASYLFVYFVLDKSLYGERSGGLYNEVVGHFFFYGWLWIFAVLFVAALSQELKMLKLSGRNIWHAFWPPCTMTALITSMFFIEQTSYVIIGLVLLIGADIFWIRLLRRNSRQSITK